MRWVFTGWLVFILAGLAFCITIGAVAR